MKYQVFLFCALIIGFTSTIAWAHGFALSLTSDATGAPIVVNAVSEATLQDNDGNPIGPPNLFSDAFGANVGSDGLTTEGFAFFSPTLSNYTATYNILSPLLFSGGTTSAAAVTAAAGVQVSLDNDWVGDPNHPGAVDGTVTIKGMSTGVGPFVPGYGVSLTDPHELEKNLSGASAAGQSYGAFGFSYEVSLTLANGQKLTSGPLVDVFATDIGPEGGFLTFAPLEQQNAAAMAIYATAIAVSEKWNVNQSANFSDGANWSQIVPNGLGFTAEFGSGATTSINAPQLTVTIDKAVFAGSLQFNTTATSYTLAGDEIAGHGLTLNNNGVGATVNVLAGNHTISAPLQLADTGGTTLNIAASSTLAITGPLANTATSSTISLNGPGTLRIASQPSFASGTVISVNSGRLTLDAQTGAPSVGAGVMINIASTATLELAGSTPTLSTGAAIVNHGVSGGGILVSAPDQVAGTITGGGDISIAPNASLTVNSIQQGTFTIGAGATLSLAASDASGNQLSAAVAVLTQGAGGALASGGGSDQYSETASVFGSGAMPGFNLLAERLFSLRTGIQYQSQQVLSLGSAARFDSPIASSSLSTAAISATVPEPSSIALIMLAAPVFVLFRFASFRRTRAAR